MFKPSGLLATQVAITAARSPFRLGHYGLTARVQRPATSHHHDASPDRSAVAGPLERLVRLGRNSAALSTDNDKDILTIDIR